MATERPRPAPESAESARELDSDAETRPPELTPLGNVQGNDPQKRKGTMRGGHDPSEMGKRSAEVRRRRGANDPDEDVSLDDVERAVLQGLKRKPGDASLLAAYERIQRLRAKQPELGHDPTTPVEEWPEHELQATRERLLLMAKRLGPPSESEGGTPPKSESRAVRSFTVPLAEPSTPPQDVPDDDGTPDGPEGATRPPDIPAPRVQPGLEGDS